MMLPRIHRLSPFVRTGLFAVFAALVLSVPFVRGDFAARAPISGFGAFYCAGRAVSMGRDPYRVQPLLDCEESLPSYRYEAVGVVEPGPLPPFVLVGFALLAVLPFGSALAVFLALSVAAMAAATWALDRITGLGVPFVGAALLLTALYHNLVLGEIPPLVIGVLSLAALLVERERLVAAAVVAAVALIEPHVAVPALAALFFVYRPVRSPLLALAALTIGTSVVMLGAATTVEYFTRVLPAHAASEVWVNDQYSLTWLLHQLGTNDAWALRLGGASYVVMAVLGVALARRLAARYERPALVVLLPAAFATIGGSYIHDIQLPIALPAALVLLAAVAAPPRLVVLTAIVLLAVPWSGGRLSLAGMVVLALIAWSAPLASRAPGATGTARRAAWTIAACAAYGAVVWALHLLPTSPAVTTAVRPIISSAPDELASAVWDRYVHVSSYMLTSPEMIGERVMRWSGLLLLALAAGWAALCRPASQPSGGGAGEPADA